MKVFVCVLTSDFPSSERLLLRIINPAFWWHKAQRSVIGRVGRICGSSFLQIWLKLVYATQWTWLTVAVALQ